MAYQVKVTLSAVDGNLSPPERTFILDGNRAIIPVGRASKSVSKGLQGAIDNAWFDSPVMSRDHAEISFNADTKTLLIRDIGSMHGTILNGVQIPDNECKEVSEGDMLTFGAEVRRGPESFSACVFRVCYEFQPYKSSNTFAFPDSSDVEDEEDYPLSEEDFSMEHLSSGDSISLGSPPPKVSQAVNAIDLTREDSPIDSYFDGIDLTGDTPVAGAISDPAAVGLQHIGNMEEANELPLGLDAVQTSLDDNDIEDGNVSSDCDSDSEAVITKKKSGYTFVCDFEKENEESDNEDEISNGDDETKMSQVSIKAAQDAAATGMVSAFKNARYGPPLVEVAENLVHDAVEDEYIELSKAGAEGIRAIMNASLLQDDPSSTFHYDHYQILYGNEPSTSTDKEDHPTLAPSSEPPEVNSSLLQVQLPSLTHGPREPSPSDAAMVKPTELNCFSTAHIQRYNTEALGEKSGKEEFFRAREHNKAILAGKKAQAEAVPGSVYTLDRQYIEESQAIPPLLTRPIKAFVGKLSRVGAPKAVVEGGPSTTYTSSFSPQPPSYYAPPALRSLLDFPDQENSKCRAPSPHLDMTSAVRYNESKASMKKPDDTTPHLCNTRSGLRIDEIIDTNSPEEGHTSLKRKSDVISDVVQDEVRMWASVYKPDNQLPATPSAASIAHIHSEPSTIQFPDIPQDQQQRPAKRLKKIMENVAYIALGGVTVGAALFGGLVATAPDFI